jgi:hypothetical protein
MPDLQTIKAAMKMTEAVHRGAITLAAANQELGTAEAVKISFGMYQQALVLVTEQAVKSGVKFGFP